MNDNEGHALIKKNNIAGVLQVKAKQLVQEVKLDDPAGIYKATAPNINAEEGGPPAVKKLKLGECLPDFQPPCPMNN